MQNRRVALTGLTVVICALVFPLAPRLLSYSTGEAAWPTTEVLYRINPANDDVSSSAAIAALQVGASAWSSQSNASVQLVYGGTTSTSAVQYDAQNTVFFRDASSGGAIATAYRWWNNSGDLLDADVIFWDASNTFFTGTSGCQNGAYIEDIAAHEFGHALGMDHSGVSGATMRGSYNSCSTSPRTLSADDVAGIEALYPPTGNTPAPSSPTNLTAVTSAASPETAIDLAWADTSGSESYFAIERSTDGQSFQFVGQNAADDTTFTDPSLSAGGTYWYRVVAGNGGGESAPSNVAWAETAAAPPPNPDPDPPPTVDPPAAPTAPAPGSGTTYASRDTDLAWSGGAGATSFDVYFGQSSSPGLYRSDVSSSQLALSKLGKNKTYYWRVVAKNAGGSTSSPTWWFSTGAGPGGGDSGDGGGSTGGGGNRGRGRNK